jgi:hypothetical protein
MEEAPTRFAVQLEPSPGGRRLPGLEHVELRLPKSLSLAFAVSELPVEVDHQVRRGMVVDFPECGNDALGSCLNERILDICDPLFADRPNARITGGERYKIGVEVQLPDLAYLKQSIIDGRYLGRKDQGGAIREFSIGVSMKSQMYDFELPEWEAFEIRLGCLGAEQNGFRRREVRRNALHLIAALG